MHFSTLAIGATLTAIQLVAADFHYGIVGYSVTSATNQYYEILPASQTSCLDAYNFQPKAAYGFAPPPQPLTADICGTQIVLNTTSGEWYTDGSAISESGVCDFINGTSGIRTAGCQPGFDSGASYLDLLSCPSDICVGY